MWSHLAAGSFPREKRRHLLRAGRVVACHTDAEEGAVGVEAAGPREETSLADKVAAAREEKAGAQRAASHRAFISYSRKDQDFVRALVDALVAEDIDAWVDWEAIPKTARWRDEIAAGIEACDSFL